MYNQIKVSGKLFKFHKQREEGASRLLKGSNPPPLQPAMQHRGAYLALRKQLLVIVYFFQKKLL